MSADNQKPDIENTLRSIDKESGQHADAGYIHWEDIFSTEDITDSRAKKRVEDALEEIENTESGQQAFRDFTVRDALLNVSANVSAPNISSDRVVNITSDTSKSSHLHENIQITTDRDIVEKTKISLHGSYTININEEQRDSVVLTGRNNQVIDYPLRDLLFHEIVHASDPMITKRTNIEQSIQWKRDQLQTIEDSLLDEASERFANAPASIQADIKEYHHLNELLDYAKSEGWEPEDSLTQRVKTLDDNIDAYMSNSITNVAELKEEIFTLGNQYDELYFRSETYAVERTNLFRLERAEQQGIPREDVVLREGYGAFVDWSTKPSDEIDAEKKDDPHPNKEHRQQYGTEPLSYEEILERFNEHHITPKEAGEELNPNKPANPFEHLALGLSDGLDSLDIIGGEHVQDSSLSYLNAEHFQVADASPTIDKPYRA